LGLEGNPRATRAGPKFKRRFATVLRELGNYPHAALLPSKRQRGRLLKVECPECGYVARVTRKWLEEAGAPICPTDEVEMIEV
jgi:peptide subunit release factor 1 (eRF1)